LKDVNKITLTLDRCHFSLGNELSRNAPDGVIVITPSTALFASGEIMASVHYDINIIIDVAKISGVIAAAWLARGLRSPKVNTQTRVNGKNLPDNEADIIKFITQEIESQKQQNQPRD
jgi:hypothetical protein